MRDSDQIRLFRPLLMGGLASRGYGNVAVIHGNQPTQQGRPPGSYVVFYKIVDNRYGFQRIESARDAATGDQIRTTTQVIQSTWQVAGVTDQTPDQPADTPTTADMLKSTATVMQSPEFQAGLLAGGANVLRIGDVRTTYVDNDRDQHESNPSFDVIITHNDLDVVTIPYLLTLKSKIFKI